MLTRTPLTKGQIWRPERWKYRPATVHFRRSSACGAQVSPAARHFAPFSHALACSRSPGSARWLEAARRTAAMAVCKAIPVPQGRRGRCRDRRDQPQQLRRKRSGRNCQCRHGLTALQKGKSAQLRTVVGGSSTGVQHRRGLLLQAQGGGTRRQYRPGRRQQLDRPVSGSRVGPDTDQSSSALLARRGKGSAAGCGSC